MIAHFLTVGQQVLILFSVMLVGVLLGKVHLLSEKASAGLSNLMMYVVSPCALIVAFQRPLEPDTFHSFITALMVATLTQLASIVVVRLVLHDSDIAKERIAQFSANFSNCGFMAYPLQTALLGSIGMFYGSAYVLPFTVLTWTYGVYLLTGDKRKLSVRALLLNPGIISVVVAMMLYLLKITLPQILAAPVGYLADLNTAVPMLIVGFQLSQANVTDVFKHGSAWVSAVLRLLILPTLTLLVCLALHLHGDVLIALTIAASAPAAAASVMFAEKFGLDSRYASSMVSVQTVFSILTMPFIVGIAQYLA
ncbi:MAG: AEC family transporter [Clostridiales bacterium]|nr:AEC family transporter [Clostridiales bacterium]